MPAPERPRLQTEFESDHPSPGLLLWQTTNRWQAVIRAALKPHGVTHVQFVLLASLTWLGAGGPITQRELADFAATDPMMTSQVLRVLESRGLVTRQPHPDDGRARAVEVTAAGANLANTAIVDVENADREFFAQAGDKRHYFIEALMRLAESR